MPRGVGPVRNKTLDASQRKPIAAGRFLYHFPDPYGFVVCFHFPFGPSVDLEGSVQLLNRYREGNWELKKGELNL